MMSSFHALLFPYVQPCSLSPQHLPPLHLFSIIALLLYYSALFHYKHPLLYVYLSFSLHLPHSLLISSALCRYNHHLLY